tara:strand:+ start:1014 stop:1979 length:966 start_codon:yes stop_codon:yes gene_type:complete
MNKKTTIISSFVVIILFLASCAPTTAPNQSIEPPAKRNSGGSISMPSGWDDSVIDKIKSGESTKNILAVLDFEGSDMLRGKADLKMSDMLTTSLFNTSRFEIVERNKIDKVFQEQNFGMSGMVDESTAAEVGKILGAEYVIFGSITYADVTTYDKFAFDLKETKVIIDVRAVNTTTGQILLSETATGTSEVKQITNKNGTVVEGIFDMNAQFAAAAKQAIERVSIKIANLSPLIGFVINVEEDIIVIDIGEEQGIEKGDQFVAFTVVEEIFHPVTKERIGWKKEILNELKIVSTEKTMSNAKITKSQSTKSLNPGDFVISK